MTTHQKFCWCGGSAIMGGGKAKGEDVCLDSEFHDPFVTGEPVAVAALYVAGPMTGYPACNYPAFNEAAEKLRAAGFTIVNPAESKVQAGHYVDFLREDLREMLDCDAVATLPNWEDSNGATNEVRVATVLMMPVETVESWLAAGPGSIDQQN